MLHKKHVCYMYSMEQKQNNWYICPFEEGKNESSHLAVAVLKSWWANTLTKILFLALGRGSWVRPCIWLLGGTLQFPLFSTAPDSPSWKVLHLPSLCTGEKVIILGQSCLRNSIPLGVSSVAWNFVNSLNIQRLFSLTFFHWQVPQKLSSRLLTCFQLLSRVSNHTQRTFLDLILFLCSLSLKSPLSL